MIGEEFSLRNAMLKEYSRFEKSKRWGNKKYLSQLHHTSDKATKAKAVEGDPSFDYIDRAWATLMLFGKGSMMFSRYVYKAQDFLSQAKNPNNTKEKWILRLQYYEKFADQEPVILKASQW